MARANGEGTVYQRKDGRYEGAAYVTTATGIRRRVRVYGRTREEAHRKLTKVIAQEHQGVPVPDRVWKLGEYLDYWLTHVVKPSVRASTFAKYESFVRLDLKPGLGRKRLDKLTTTDVRMFLTGRQHAGDSGAQLQAMHAILRNAIQNAMREDLVMRNVVTLVRQPKPEERDVYPWSADEAKQFLDVSRDHALHAAFVLVLALGLRKGEALGVGWDDIDLTAATLRVRWQIQRQNGRIVRVPVKTKRSRRAIPLPDLCVRVLKKRRAEQAGDRAAATNWHDEWNLVFTTRHGTPYEPRNMNRAFDNLCTKAGVRRVRVHDTRHGCATLLAAVGVESRTIMDILGHSQIAVTMNVYTHVSTQAKRDALKHMDHLLGDLDQDDET
jgi:integrase